MVFLIKNLLRILILLFSMTSSLLLTYRQQAQLYSSACQGDILKPIPAVSVELFLHTCVPLGFCRYGGWRYGEDPVFRAAYRGSPEMQS